MPINIIDLGANGDGTTDDTSAFQSALNSAYSKIFVPVGTYIIDSVSITAPVEFVCEKGAVFKRKAGSVGGGSYWNPGTAMFEIDHDGFDIAFAGFPVFDGNKAGQTSLKRINPTSGTISAPDGWIIKYSPQSMSNSSDNRLLIENSEFKNGTAGYLLLRGADASKNFRTIVHLINPLMTDTVTGYGKGDPACSSSLGWNSDYIQALDHIDIIARDLTAIYSEGHTHIGEYAPVAIRGSYYGTNASNSGEASARLEGVTTLIGMGRKSETYDGSAVTGNNGIGAIDFYGNTDTLYCEFLEAKNCEQIPFRAKTDCDRFEIEGGRLTGNEGGGIQVSNASTAPVTKVTIRDILCRGGTNPQISVTGLSSSSKIKRALIENCEVVGGTNDNELAEQYAGGIYLRYIEGVSVLGCNALDQDRSGIHVRDCDYVRMGGCFAEDVGLEGILFANIAKLLNATACFVNGSTNRGGISIVGGDGRMLVENCVTENTYGYGILSTSSGHTTIGTCKVSGIGGASRGFYISQLGKVINCEAGSGVMNEFYPSTLPLGVEHTGNEWN